MTKVALTAALLSLLTAASVQAATARYSSALFFGDSLSDPGNLYALTSATIGVGVPPPPYFQGRTSNGPVWAEHIAADFTAKGLYSANYAYSYGQAVTNVDIRFPGGLQVPDLPAQIDAFKASGTGGLLGDRPVASLWAGSNDLFTAAPATIGTVAAAAANAIAGGIEALAEAGIRDFVVFNMVPLEKTPRFTTLGTPEERLVAKLGVDTFNATLDGLLAGVGEGTRVTKIDIHAAMSDLIANPDNYGVSDVANPCYIPVAGALPCTAEQAAEQAFFDPVHPNAVIHGEIAELARAEMVPVPLPAPVLLLLGALAGMAGVGVRRRA